METDTEQVRKLIDGQLSWEELRNDVLPDPKDDRRFEVTRQIIQERVPFDEPVLVPINDHLLVVGSDEGRVVRCDCGHEFCDADENWKENARVRVREGKEAMEEIYPEYQTPHPDWDNQLREWFCPGCMAQVDVDAVPAGYPVKQSFEPDVDTFYEEWLGEPAPDQR